MKTVKQVKNYPKILQNLALKPISQSEKTLTSSFKTFDDDFSRKKWSFVTCYLLNTDFEMIQIFIVSFNEYYDFA